MFFQPDTYMVFSKLLDEIGEGYVCKYLYIYIYSILKLMYLKKGRDIKTWNKTENQFIKKRRKHTIINIDNYSLATRIPSRTEGEPRWSGIFASNMKKKYVNHWSKLYRLYELATHNLKLIYSQLFITFHSEVCKHHTVSGGYYILK